MSRTSVQSVGSNSRLKPAPFGEVRRSLLDYGPFRLAEPIFWLLFASTLRVVAVRNPVLAPLLIAAEFAILFAFISATARMVERMRGRTTLVDLSFDDTLVLAKRMMGQILRLLLCCALVAISLAGLGIVASPETYLSFLIVTDGIAFDSRGLTEKILCAFSALLIFLMTVNAGTGRHPTIDGACAEFARHWRDMTMAYVLALAFLIVLSAVQGVVREMAWMAINDLGGEKVFAARVVFYAFVVGFAVVRLFGLVAICAWFLRRSYGRVG